ncbi:16S rRNA (cytosine(1402)-N(4))-methyltransferase, partial [Candidatus Gottesmanbacteria bacterium RBG_16_37_8]
QVIDLLKIKKGSLYIDATVGFGGYAFEIINRGGKVLGIDADKDAIFYIKEKINKSPKNNSLKSDLILYQGNYRNLKLIAAKFNILQVSGIIIDLGLSSYQLDKSKRGFTYLQDEPLDMRFDKDSNLKALDVVNKYSKEELYEIFTKHSEELYSRSIAEAIVRTRTLKGEIATTGQLTKVILSVFKDSQNVKINSVLGRIFQAIRIEVNGELENIKSVLPQAAELLDRNGRLCILSYHSLEDRIVKNFMKKASQNRQISIVTKKPVTADYGEIKINSRSRGVKLRVAEKI